MRKMIKESPIKWSWKHAKGHQGDDRAAALGTWATLLSTEVGNLAKARWMSQAPHAPTQSAALKGDEVRALRVNGEKVSSRAGKVIYDHVHGEAVLARWVRKKRFQPADHSRKMSWGAAGRHHWVAKRCSGHCGVSVKMKLWKKRGTEGCPRCSEREAVWHVRRRQDPEARSSKSRGLLAIRKALKDAEAQKGMSRVTMACLTSWSGVPK